jgi:hypothetical protein
MIHFYPQMPATVWIKFGTSMKPKYIPVHDTARKINPKMLKTILAYHAITGCDTTSAFSGHTKASSWITFNVHADLVDYFGQYPELSETQHEKAEIVII